MRALLASPLGFLIGLSLGALGAGGSILAVPALVYGAGQDPRSATTTSLLLVGGAAVVGMGAHFRAGRVRVGTGVAFGLAGIPGSIAGTWVNQRLDPDVLLLAFSGLVLIAAWRMVTGCPTCTRVGEERSTAVEPPPPTSGGVLTTVRHRVDLGRVVALLAAGSFVGFLTGLFGVGGGFVVIPALTLLLGFNMPQAIGTSLLVVAINTAVAFAGRLATTDIDWAVTLPFAVAAILGVLAGSRLAGRLDPQRTLRAFAAVLVAVAVYTAVDAALAIW